MVWSYTSCLQICRGSTDQHWRLRLILIGQFLVCVISWIQLTSWIACFIGFSNIGQMILAGDNLSSDALITSTSPTQKKSKHFSMLCAWIRQFYVATSCGSSTLLQASCRQMHLRNVYQKIILSHAGMICSASFTLSPSLQPVDTYPSKDQPDHHELWPVVPCSATADYDDHDK